MPQKQGVWTGYIWQGGREHRCALGTSVCSVLLPHTSPVDGNAYTCSLTLWLGFCFCLELARGCLGSYMFVETVLFQTMKIPWRIEINRRMWLCFCANTKKAPVFTHTTHIELKAKSNKCCAASDRVNLCLTLGDTCSSSPVSRLLSVTVLKLKLSQFVTVVQRQADFAGSKQMVKWQKEKGWKNQPYFIIRQTRMGCPSSWGCHLFCVRPFSLLCDPYMSVL